MTRISYIFLVLGMMIFLCSCSDHVSDSVDKAFEEFNNGRINQSQNLLKELLAEGVSDYSVYDKANVGLAALIIGVECHDIELSNIGYKLSAEALRLDSKECDDVLKYENYFDDSEEVKSYRKAVQIFYSGLEDLKLAESAVGTWYTTYNNNTFGESHSTKEYLTLNADNSFSEKKIISVNGTEGDYKYRCKAETTVDGKWEIKDQTLLLRYKTSTLNVYLVPEEFKITLTNAAIWSGAAFDLAFMAVASENDVKKQMESELYDELNELYNSNTAWQISFEDNEMILQSYTTSYTYSRQ